VAAQAAVAEAKAAAADELMARDAAVAEPMAQEEAASKVKILRVWLWAIEPVLSEQDLRTAAQHATDTANGAQVTDAVVDSLVKERSPEQGHEQGHEDLFEAAKAATAAYQRRRDSGARPSRLSCEAMTTQAAPRQPTPTPGPTHHAAPCASPRAAPRTRVQVVAWCTAGGGGVQLDMPLLGLSVPLPAERATQQPASRRNFLRREDLSVPPQTELCQRVNWTELRQARRIEQLVHATVEHLLEQLRPRLTQPPQYSFSVESIPCTLLETGEEGSPGLATHSSASSACCNSPVGAATDGQASNLDDSTSPSPSRSSLRSPPRGVRRTSSPRHSRDVRPHTQPRQAAVQVPPRSLSSSHTSSPSPSRHLRAKSDRRDFRERTLGRYEA